MTTRTNTLIPLATALFIACAHQPRLSDAPLPPLSAQMNTAGRAYVFTTIDVPNSRRTVASGINDRGDIVGYFDNSAGTTRGFLRRGGTVTVIEFPGAAFTEARGIGPTGEIVGSYRMPGEPALNFHGFRLTSAGQFVRVDYPGHINTIVQRILPDGTILGCRHDNDFGASMYGVVIGTRGRSETDAVASMHNGATPDLRRIAGLYQYKSWESVSGYVIDDGTFKPLVVPGSTSTAAWDVNSAGEVVGFYRDASGFHGFALIASGYVPIDAPGATGTQAFGTNDNGDVVGSFVAGGSTYAFLAAPMRQRDR
jgi:probable HAF family extracellular repeat protein